MVTIFLCLKNEPWTVPDLTNLLPRSFLNLIRARAHGDRRFVTSKEIQTYIGSAFGESPSWRNIMHKYECHSSIKSIYFTNTISILCQNAVTIILLLLKRNKDKLNCMLFVTNRIAVHLASRQGSYHSRHRDCPCLLLLFLAALGWREPTQSPVWPAVSVWNSNTL